MSCQPHRVTAGLSSQIFFLKRTAVQSATGTFESFCHGQNFIFMELVLKGAHGMWSCTCRVPHYSGIFTLTSGRPTLLIMLCFRQICTGQWAEEGENKTESGTRHVHQGCIGVERAGKHKVAWCSKHWLSVGDVFILLNMLVTLMRELSSHCDPGLCVELKQAAKHLRVLDKNLGGLCQNKMCIIR